MTATPVLSASASGPDDRLEVLDGMRGLAALAVVAYHFMARWAEPQFSPTLYAHGDALATFPPIQMAGAFGVQLFFLISGFVIMMTLERSSGLLDFTVRRAARLWPAMLVCATLSTVLINTSGVAYVYENVARWQVTPVEYVSSLFFLPPDLMAQLFNIPQGDLPRWVEGVYWTLWAEVRFYALIALAYWLSPRGAFLWVWAGLQGASLLVDLAGQVNGGGLPGFAQPAVLALQPDMLCWFTFGLVAWKWRSLGAHPALVVSLLFALAALLAGPVIDLAGGIALSDVAARRITLFTAVFLFFGLFLAGSPLLKPLTWKPVIAVGLASYPLYLFHERPGMIYLHWLNSAGVPAWVSLAIAIAVVIATALALHHLVEKPGKRLILSALLTRAHGLEARFSALRMPRNA